VETTYLDLYGASLKGEYSAQDVEEKIPSTLAAFERMRLVKRVDGKTMKGLQTLEFLVQEEQIRVEIVPELRAPSRRKEIPAAVAKSTHSPADINHASHTQSIPDQGDGISRRRWVAYVDVASASVLLELEKNGSAKSLVSTGLQDQLRRRLVAIGAIKKVQGGKDPWIMKRTIMQTIEFVLRDEVITGKAYLVKTTTLEREPGSWKRNLEKIVREGKQNPIPVKPVLEKPKSASLKDANFWEVFIDAQSAKILLHIRSGNPVGRVIGHGGIKRMIAEALKEIGCLTKTGKANASIWSIDASVAERITFSPSDEQAVRKLKSVIVASSNSPKTKWFLKLNLIATARGQQSPAAALSVLEPDSPAQSPATQRIDQDLSTMSEHDLRALSVQLDAEIAAKMKIKAQVDQFLDARTQAHIKALEAELAEIAQAEAELAARREKLRNERAALINSN